MKQFKQDNTHGFSDDDLNTLNQAFETIMAGEDIEAAGYENYAEAICDRLHNSFSQCDDENTAKLLIERATK